MEDRKKVLASTAASHGISAKLLVGERVEVRQLDKGLRGSWHPAIVVKVKPGRRIVEYDELLSNDGLSKLRESIPVARDMENIRILGRQYSNPRIGCGLLRPRPPTFSNSYVQCWTNGLFVDAFYEDAWWEGILVGNASLAGGKNLSSDKMNFNVNVLFPDEGDEQCIPLKKLRLSLYWNEVTGDWVFKGQSNFPNLDTVDNLLSLVERWKQDRRMGIDLCKKECKIFDLIQDSGFILSGEKMDIDRNYKLREAHSVDLHVRQILIPESCSQLESTHKDRGANLLADYHQQDDRSLRRRGVNSNSSMPLVSQGSRQMHIVHSIDNCNERVLQDSSSAQQRPKCCMSTRLMDSPICRFSKKRKKRVLFQSFQKRENKCSCSDVQLVQGSPFKSKEVKLSKAIVSLLSSKKPQKELVQTSSKVEDGAWVEENNGNKAEFTGLRLVTHDVGSDNNTNFPDIDYNRILKSARDAAKEMLLDVGWQIKFRERQDRGREAVYVSSDGNRKFYSLAEACRFWRKCQNISSENYHGKNFYATLLESYDLTDDLELLEVHLTRAKKKKLSGSLEWNNDSKRVEGEPQKEISSNLNNDLTCKGEMIVQSHTENPISTIGIEASNKFSSIVTEEINHKKSVSISTQEVGLKTSHEHGSKLGSRFKGDLLPHSEETLPCQNKCKKRKCTMQDIQPLSYGTHPKKRSVSKKSNSNMEKKDGRNRGGFHMQVLLSLPSKDGEMPSSQVVAEASHFKKRTVLSWLIDMGVLAEDERVCYLNRKYGHVMKEGHVSREGVICSCCKALFTLSNFEFHAGSRLHRPSANMFMDDGRSLFECQMQAWALQNGSKKHSSITDITEGCNDSSDDTCGICSDGGKLILCDNCPSTFHAECMGLETIPEGDWFCPSCCCGVCGRSHFGSDGSKFGEKTAYHCHQCEREYHLSCLGRMGMPRRKTNLDATWFCCDSCEKIFLFLHGLVGLANPLEQGLSCTLLRCIEEDPQMNIEIVAEHNSKLSVALAVMRECFVAMIDPRTKIDIIAQILYNRRSKFHRLNFHGFYTILLERGDEIISVATLRVHGLKVAEMPLIGTRFQYRRQGMCRRLMQALEEMLRSIGVEKLILPAVPELLDTWLNSFNFQHMNNLERRELMKLNLVSFPGTTALQKFLVMQRESSDDLLRIKNPTSQMLSLQCNTSSFKVGELMVQSVKDLQNKIARTTHGSVNADQPRVAESRQSCASDAKSHSYDKMQASPSGTVQNVGFLNGRPTETAQEFLASAQSQTFTNQKLSVLERNRVVDQRKCRHSEWIDQDDPYRSKVVLTTTRSKRLVKSSRWVVDALKELCRNGKNLCRSPLVHEGLIGSVARDLEAANENSVNERQDIHDDAGVPAINVAGLIIQNPTIYNGFESPTSSLALNDSSRMIADLEARGPSCNDLKFETTTQNDGQGHDEDIRDVYGSAQKGLFEKTVISEEFKSGQRKPDSSMQPFTSSPQINSNKVDGSNCDQDVIPINVNERLSDGGLLEVLTLQDRYTSIRNAL